MANVLFTNVRILDGTGAQPYAGRCWCRATASARSAAARARSRRSRRDRDRRRRRDADARHVRGAHAFLVERRRDAGRDPDACRSKSTCCGARKVAKQLPRHAGFTSCVGAACAKPRLDVVIRNAINSGQIPGPRYLAASQEITVPGGLGDETLPHLPFPEFSFGVNVSGAEEMRKAVRMFLKYGVDSIKLNLSGDNFTPRVAAPRPPG